MNVQKITVDQLQECVNHFQKFSKTYFWTSPSTAQSRRAEEKRNSKTWEFVVDGEKVIASVDVSCSCRNYYSERSVEIGGIDVRMMVPFLKKCLKALQEQK